MMVLAYAAFAGICFFIQGCFYLQRGIDTPFFWVGDSRKRLSTYRRIVQGLICVTIGIGLLTLVISSLQHRPGGIVGGHLQPAALLGGPGILFMLSPDVGLRLVGRNAALVSQESSRRTAIVRAIGGLLLLGGLLFLTA
jgi:hypothetical protein